jgi:class 3 adenylate cyclase/tetratricopeptide (TPR) repeat protein
MADSPSTPRRAPDPTAIRTLEIAHVLFTDIVGYSKLPMDKQEQLLMQFQDTVRQTAEFVRAQADDQLIRLPTGDGMALVFFGDAEAPVRCAIEIGRSLRRQPALQLRMGVHTGPVYRVADINANRNVAGGGINIAQRVMDCGDAGHILVSSAEADVLCQVSAWCNTLHDLGEVEVKHGVRIHLYNLYTEEAGNPQLPRKISGAQATSAAAATKAKNKKISTVVIAGVAILTLVSVGGWLYYTRKAHALSATDTVVLADFANTTGDAVFDDTLKQGLAVELAQSPFLNILSDSKVSATLKQMTRPASAALTPDVAREVCQRTASKAYIRGSIASLGSEFVIGLKAVSCQSGDGLAQEQLMAASKEKVLGALGEAATTLREKLGESLASVQKFDVPLEQATTSSLEALKTYSMATRAEREKGSAAAIPFYQRAADLDPKFASAYSGLGISYWNIREPGRARENLQTSFALRDRVSEREEFGISALYYSIVTGDLQKAVQTLELWTQTYPRDTSAHGNLGTDYWILGQSEKAVAQHLEALRLNPDSSIIHADLMADYISLNRLDEAKAVYREALARKLDNPDFHNSLYWLAFLQNDAQGMQRQVAWAAAIPELKSVFTFYEADTAAYSGKLEKARQLFHLGVASAIQENDKNAQADCELEAALTEALFGNTAEARKLTVAALKLSTDRDAKAAALMALAFAGQSMRVRSLADDFATRFPEDTLVQFNYLPTIRAQLALNRNDPSNAIATLRAAASHELGKANLTDLYPIYVRGEAYLVARQGGEAAAEFQKLLDHRGAVTGEPIGALARLGVARAYALEAKSAQGSDAENYRIRARTAYRDFLTLWKDADRDIPVLKQAQAEYAKLQ